MATRSRPLAVPTSADAPSVTSVLSPVSDQMHACVGEALFAEEDVRLAEERDDEEAERGDAHDGPFEELDVSKEDSVLAERLRDSCALPNDGANDLEEAEGDGQKGGEVQEEASEEEFEDARESVSPLKRALSAEASQAEVALTESPEWKDRRKHIFILSEAGKPIYSLNGDEDELASLMAVMQAIVSYAAEMTSSPGDSLRSMTLVDGGTVAFAVKGPLILVAVSKGGESAHQLYHQLTYMYNQVQSVLTLSQLTKVFTRSQGKFDLRRMIAGSERLLRSLSEAMDNDACFLMSAAKVLPMPQQAREAISSAITTTLAKKGQVVFAVLVAANQLVTLVRMKKYFLHPMDLHLLFNLVNATASLKHSETWIPICLPKFDSR